MAAGFAKCTRRMASCLGRSNAQNVRPTGRCSMSFASRSRRAFRDSPVSMSLATLTTLVGIGSVAYAGWCYRSFVGEMQTKYPQAVADELRRALYYTNAGLDVKSAIKHYRRAIELSGHLGMDPFSDEVLGIKIEVAHLFEKAGLLPQAIRTLEMVREDCLDWLRENPLLEARDRLLAKMIGLSLRLGSHYEEVEQRARAEEVLVWAVTTALRERQARPDWLADEELGAVLEALASLYSRQTQHHLSTPLFLQALNLCPSRSCHAVTLMSNLATSLALQNPPGQSPSQVAQVSSAQEWARKALLLAQQIKPPDRTPECDQGQAVATINLGDFAMMRGNRAEAENFWRQGRVLCQSFDLPDGIARAEEALNHAS